MWWIEEVTFSNIVHAVCYCTALRNRWMRHLAGRRCNGGATHLAWLCQYKRSDDDVLFFSHKKQYRAVCALNVL
jgi:hypothetical protein